MRLGFKVGIHFTAKRLERNARGYIYLRVPASLWRLEELRRQGVGWADKALKQLEEIAEARGFSDRLEKYLKPAREAETVDPRGLVVENAERGIKAVIRDVKVMWEDGRPRVVVEYEVNGQVEFFSFIWGIATKRKVTSNVRLNETRALVLAALLGDETIKEKRGPVQLHTKNLFSLAKYKGVGWGLLKWYAEVMKEEQAQEV